MANNRLFSVVVLGKKDKGKSCCPACAAEQEAKQIVRKQNYGKRQKV
jgi:hypothetical protein